MIFGASVRAPKTKIEPIRILVNRPPESLPRKTATPQPDQHEGQDRQHQRRTEDAQRPIGDALGLGELGEGGRGHRHGHAGCEEEANLVGAAALLLQGQAARGGEKWFHGGTGL